MFKTRKLDAERTAADRLELPSKFRVKPGRRGGPVGSNRIPESGTREVAGHVDYARIQKNINLLSLEGKPAPPLELKEFLGPRPNGSRN